MSCLHAWQASSTRRLIANASWMRADGYIGHLRNGIADLRTRENSDMSADSFRSGRRIVLAGLSAAAATVGAAGSGSSRTDAQPLTPATSRPSAGAQDEWLDD